MQIASMERSGERIETIEVKANNMTLLEVIDRLQLETFGGKEGMDREVLGAYVSDLLSDVMGHAGGGEIWITLQSHVNVAAIASLKELAAVILVKGIQPDPAMLSKANEEGVPVLGTELNTYHITGLLYGLLES